MDVNCTACRNLALSMIICSPFGESWCIIPDNSPVYEHDLGTNDTFSSSKF